MTSVALEWWRVFFNAMGPIGISCFFGSLAIVILGLADKITGGQIVEIFKTVFGKSSDNS